MRTPPSTASLLAALLALFALTLSAEAQHGGMTMMAGVHPSINMTDPCYTAPWDANCTTFRRSHSEWTDDITSLCTAMPYMIGCTLYNECKPQLDAKKEVVLDGKPANVSAAFGTYCGMVSLVADICVEMPRMKGCEAYLALCGMENSTVAACDMPGPVPGVLWTWDTKQAVDELCAADATAAACTQCSSRGNMNMSACPDPLSTLKLLCDETPDAQQCFNLTEMCLVNGTEVFVSTCAGYNPTEEMMMPSSGGHGSGGMMPGVHVSINMTDPCYTAPWDANCTTFRRAHSEWTDDITSLCAAMPYMIGCSMYSECKPLLDAKKEAMVNGVLTNVSAAFGTYCGMPNLVGAICIEMPRMKGCEAWLALCGMENSTVSGCKQPGVIPGVLWTWDTKQAVDGLCAVDAEDKPPCAQCDSKGRMNMASCPDPLSTLTMLCLESPSATQCGNLTAMCNVANVSTVLPNTCGALAGAIVNGATMVVSLTLVVVVLAAALQLLL